MNELPWLALTAASAMLITHPGTIQLLWPQICWPCFHASFLTNSNTSIANPCSRLKPLIARVYSMLFLLLHRHPSSSTLQVNSISSFIACKASQAILPLMAAGDIMMVHFVCIFIAVILLISSFLLLIHLNFLIHILISRLGLQ